jgi:hypothetical protein
MMTSSGSACLLTNAKRAVAISDRIRSNRLNTNECMNSNQNIVYAART